EMDMIFEGAVNKVGDEGANHRLGNVLILTAARSASTGRAHLTLIRRILEISIGALLDRRCASPSVKTTHLLMARLDLQEAHFAEPWSLWDTTFALPPPLPP
ncbi:hypothetical protein Ancab_021202, partial [Ancistrocladus abbreviatus]